MQGSTKLGLSNLLIIGGCILLGFQDIPPYSTIGGILIIIGVIICLYVILPLTLPLNEEGTLK